MTVMDRLHLKEVAEFDKSSFDQKEWDISEWRDQKTRHIALHIAKIPLKIMQGDEAVIESEVMPDMALYRTQLVQTHQLEDLGIIFDLSFPPHINGWNHPVLEKEITQAGASNFAFKRSALANGFLASYLEPSEHDECAEDEERQTAVLSAAHALHVGALALAKEFKADLGESLINRIQHTSRFFD